MQITIGIDVSEHNGVLNWSLIKAAGVKFAFIRATYGLLIDKSYKRNVEGATLAGIEHGAYHYNYPRWDAAAQADNFLSTIRDSPHTLLPAHDIEEPLGIPRLELHRRYNAFTDIIDKAFKCLCWIYSGSGFWLTYMSNGVFSVNTHPDEYHLMDHPHWMPAYRQGFPDQFFPWLGWDIHQWTDRGRITGITGPVDLNRTWLSLEELKMRGRNGK